MTNNFALRAKLLKEEWLGSCVIPIVIHDTNANLITSIETEHINMMIMRDVQ